MRLKTSAMLAYGCVIVTLGATCVCTVVVADRSAKRTLSRAVQDSVRLNSADRAKNTAEIIRRLERLEQRIVDGKPASDIFVTFR